MEAPHDDSRKELKVPQGHGLLGHPDQEEVGQTYQYSHCGCHVVDGGLTVEEEGEVADELGAGGGQELCELAFDDEMRFCGWVWGAVLVKLRKFTRKMTILNRMSRDCLPAMVVL